jgi:hypothetical protein
VRRAILLVLLAFAGAAFATPAAAAGEWRSEQPVAAGLGVPASLGPVGDVEFQAPNRGMLITAGNGGNPAGLYAYDGTGWYRYSTVCGGHEGRIAWAGPDDFWTISDQQAGQETGKAPPQHISLCHFKAGQVVASYAEPVGLPSSYLPMNAAACSGPDDCWFAGDPLPGTTNVGAFHLHWDGATLTAVPSPTEPQPEIVDPGRAVESLAFHQGSLYESVAIGEEDVAPGEPPSQPSFLHRIAEGAADPFEPLFTAEPIVYGGAGAEPTQLEAFRLTGDDEGLWAIAGATSDPATVTALRLGEGGFEQVGLEDPGGVLGPGDRVGGAAAEPGGEDAWVGFREPGDKVSPLARLTRIHADGTVDPPTLLPGEGEGIGHKGPAGPVACPAPGQCWMATGEGWLFHLGPDLPQDTDPVLHVLVSYRPPDDSLPSVPPISLPEDNSGAELPAGEPPDELGEIPPTRRPRPLYSGLHQRLIGKSLLEMTFVLHARAHVRLLARRKGHVVAETPRLTMAKGPRSLRLRLDPERWPSRLDLEVHAVGKRAGR